MSAELAQALCAIKDLRDDLAAAERERDEAVARAEKAEREAEHYRGAGELLVGAEEERQAAEARLREVEGALAELYDAVGVWHDPGHVFVATHAVSLPDAVQRALRALADAGKGEANG